MGALAKVPGESSAYISLGQASDEGHLLEGVIEESLIAISCSTCSIPSHKARAKALPIPCGVTSSCLANDDYIAASFTSLEASLNSSCTLVLFFLQSFWCIYGCATIYRCGRVVVFLLVNMPQSSPCVWCTVLVLVQFSKINQTTRFLARSLQTRLLMIINTIQVGCSPPVTVKKDVCFVDNPHC
jgi:hypothetical protein